MKRDSRSGDDSDAVESERSPADECHAGRIRKEHKREHKDRNSCSGVYFHLLMLCMEAIPELQTASGLLYLMAVSGFPWINLNFWTHLFLWTLSTCTSVTSTFNYPLGKKPFPFLGTLSDNLVDCYKDQRVIILFPFSILFLVKYLSYTQV